MKNIILEALKLGLWRQLDVQFAYMLVKHSLVDNSDDQNFLILAVIVLSAYINQGHVCLPLIRLTPNHIFYGSHYLLANQAWQKSGSLSIHQWQELLLNSDIVSDGSYLAPLVLDHGCLYLYRMWCYECLIANFFYSSSSQLINISIEENNKIKKLLNQLFSNVSKFNCIHQDGTDNIDWQKIAVIMALTRKITVISGGPGTGKTSIVSKILAMILLMYSNVSLNIKLAAPTGKSAARLYESVHLMIKQLHLININYRQFDVSIESVTLHRLLGMSFDRQNINRANYNFSFLDYLIIDESSMIDLFMMVKIIKCLSSKTKIVFLGDYNQLPSVEPGSIFTDICYFIKEGYTSKFCQQIKNLTDYTLPCNYKNKYHFSDNLCLLYKNYRFTSISEIGKLANAVNIGDNHVVLSLLHSKLNTNIYYMVLKNRKDYFTMLLNCALGYSKYLKSLTHYTYIHLKSILSIFSQYRVLSVLRDGPFGVLELNILIENILRNKGLIHLIKGDKNYIGRPIIITSNDFSLSLFNGDTGIILPDNNNDITYKNLFAYFLLSDGKIQKISLHKLPKHETNFVMTVHKAQGSEFEHISLIFPDKITSILTKELFYTGITRARKRLSIYANNAILNHTIGNSYKRCSGLIDRLKYYNKK